MINKAKKILLSDELDAKKSLAAGGAPAAAITTPTSTNQTWNDDIGGSLSLDSGKNMAAVDSLVSSTGFGRKHSPITDVFAGLDHRHTGSAFQRNTDHQGLVLFSRPRLNLSYDNIVTSRQMLPLLSGESEANGDLSPFRAIRVMLDPPGVSRGVTSRLFDHRQAFMPLLTNTCLSVSGFPDITINTYVSTEGIRKESWSMVDDVAEYNQTVDLTATFSNIEGDPITSMFHLWLMYMGGVYSGDLVPYADEVLENSIDYQTAIWRIILDKSQRYVRKIARVIAFPMASPLGASFNFTNDTPFIRDNDQIAVPFRGVGLDYNDPILFYEFNAVVIQFNPTMQDGIRESAYRKLRPNEHRAFNYKGYPRIDPVTMELEWWVSPQDEIEVYG